MIYTEFHKECLEIAVKLANKKKRFPRMYLLAVKEFVRFLSDNRIEIKDAILRLSKEDIRKLHGIVFRKHNYHCLSKCICLNEILEKLKLLKRYEGYYLNIPLQVSRQLVVDLTDDLSNASESFKLVMDYLFGLKQDYGRASEETIADYFFCEFLAISMLSGALYRNFHRDILDAKFSDLTLNPLSFRRRLSAVDKHPRAEDRGGEDVSYLRYWMPPIAEAYFLRLILFLHKRRRRLKLEFQGDYIFPVSWRTNENISGLPNKFLKWIQHVTTINKVSYPAMSLATFRKKALFRLSMKLPSFVIAALSGDIKCDSLDLKHLSILDPDINRHLIIEIPGRHKKPSKKGRKDSPKEESLAKKRLAEGKKVLFESRQFASVYKKITKSVWGISRDANLAVRIEESKKITEIISSLPEYDSKAEDKFLINLRFLGQWIVSQLESKEIKVKSIHTYASQLWRSFLFILGNRAINELKSEELADMISVTFELYDSSNIRSAIQCFTDVLYDYQDDFYPKMAWDRLLWSTNRNLRKADIKRTKSLASFTDVKNALSFIETKDEDEEIDPVKLKLRIAVILGFYAGLRVSEIFHIQVSDLIADGGYTLYVRRSKSSSGERCIPLSLLLPDGYLKEVVNFFRNSRSKEEASIFAESEPYAESRDCSRTIRKIFAKSGTDIGFHDLRHSFANWFLLRGIAAISEARYLPSHAPFFKEELFSPKYLRRVREVMHGFGEPSTGQSLFSYILPALARLLGHAGPVTTVSSYIHIADWLSYVVIRAQGGLAALKMKSSEIEDFMQLSYPSLPQTLRKRKSQMLPLDILISEQGSLLKKLIEKI